MKTIELKDFFGIMHTYEQKESGGLKPTDNGIAWMARLNQWQDIIDDALQRIEKNGQQDAKGRLLAYLIAMPIYFLEMNANRDAGTNWGAPIAFPTITREMLPGLYQQCGWEMTAEDEERWFPEGK